MTRLHEAVVAIVILAVPTVTAQADIAALMAQGYGATAWIFFAVYFASIVTIGVYRIRWASKAVSASSG